MIWRPLSHRMELETQQRSSFGMVVRSVWISCQENVIHYARTNMDWHVCKAEFRAWFFVFLPTFQIKIIHLFIARIYIVTLRGIYSGALPTQSWLKRTVNAAGMSFSLWRIYFSLWMEQHWDPAA